jgi:hypothetical protein
MRRTGLSRAEVLVVVLLLAVLAGLFLVGIGKMRGAANLQHCRNNLKQLGLAVHNYASTYNDRLPPLIDEGKGALTGRRLASLLATLMIYMSSESFGFHPNMTAAEYHAHSSVPFTDLAKDGIPGPISGGRANWPWRVFFDPGDETAHQLRDVPMTLPDGSTGYYATGSYAANGLAPWGVRGMGKAFPNGMENTVLIGERPQVCRTAAGDEVYNLWGLGFYSPHMPAFATLTPADPPGLLATGQVAPVPPLPDEGAADRDSLIRVRVGRRDAEPGRADFPTPVQRVRAGRACDPRLPGGPHRAGMQVVMADGSVRVFGWDTDPWAFWAACVPGGAAHGPDGPP